MLCPSNIAYLVSLTQEAIALLRSRELEVAKEKVQNAARDFEAKSYECRTETIASINDKLVQIKKARKKLQEQISCLPESEKLFAEVQIGDVVDSLYSDVIVDLKKQKRKYSRIS